MSSAHDTKKPSTGDVAHEEHQLDPIRSTDMTASGDNGGNVDKRRVTHESVLVDSDKALALGEFQSTRPSRTPWQALKAHKKIVLLIAVVQTNAIIVGVQFSLPGVLLGMPAYVRVFGVETAPGVFAIEAKVLTIWAALFATFQVLGQITGGFQSDYFGRRICLYTVIFWTYAGCVCEVVARDWRVWLASKIVLGFATGIMQSVVPTYVSEVAPRELRGISLSFFNLCMNLGSLWATLLAWGTEQRWPSPTDERSFRVPLYITLAIPTISLVLELIMLVESPWYLLMRGKRDQASRTLARMHSWEPEYDLDAEMAELEYTIQKEAQLSELAKQSSYLDCFKGVDARRTFCAVFPPITQNLTGQNLAGTYGTYFFSLAGSSNPLIDSVITTAVGLACNFISFFLLENKRFGRWRLLMGGLIVMTLCMLGIGLIGVIGNGEYNSSTGAALVFLVSLFIGASTLGPGVTGWAYTGESGSARLRAKTTTLGTMGNAIIGLIMTSVLPYMLNDASAGGQGWNIRTAWMFFILGVCCVITVYFFIPEYRGRSYAQLDELFARRIPARHFAMTETTGAYGNDLRALDLGMGEREQREA